MIRVTWEWLGQGLALDLADTVTVVDGSEHDLIATRHDYGRWAGHEAKFLPEGGAARLERARPELLRLRTAVRRVLAAVAAGERPPPSAVEELNSASRGAPDWFELDAGSLTLREKSSGRSLDKLLASYARSAMEIVAHEGSRLRRCPAPSCGMFYLSTRGAQRWCSVQCGTRARVARHYRSKAEAS